MSDDPMDRVPAFDRVSVAAVVVRDGEDPTAALLKAGITDPIAVPVVFGEDLPAGILGDGVTPNLVAVIETEQQEDDDTSPHAAINRVESHLDQTQSPTAVTGTLPAAFGMKPLAPVRPRGA